jgi:hypothetical protein
MRNGRVLCWVSRIGMFLCSLLQRKEGGIDVVVVVAIVSAGGTVNVTIPRTSLLSS